VGDSISSHASRHAIPIDPAHPRRFQAMKNTQRTTRLQDKLAYQAWNALGNTASQDLRLGSMYLLGEHSLRDPDRLWPRSTTKTTCSTCSSREDGLSDSSIIDIAYCTASGAGS
jgi:hypothetical protein